MRIFYPIQIILFIMSGVVTGDALAHGLKKKNHFGNSGKSYDATEYILDTPTVKTTLEGKTFLVKDREFSLGRGACTQCHGTDKISLSEMSKRPSFQNGGKTHKNIVLFHGNKQGMTCKTCHDLTSVRHLKNPNNDDKIEINEAFLSCQGCHFSEVRDWIGGSHGKRVKVWAEPRVIYNCADCHNPHDPSFKKRLPKAISTLPEKR